MSVTKYSELSKDSLRREVAARLGYRVEGARGLEEPWVYQAYMPDGTPVSWAMSYEGKAWRELEEIMPDWPESTDTALELPVDEDIAWNIFVSGGRNLTYLEKLIPPSGESGGVWHGNQNRTLAESMCIAWLAWKDAQK